MRGLDQRLQDLERRQSQTGMRLTKACRDSIVAAALAGPMPLVLASEVHKRAAVEAAFRADL